jgi:hypothetical protein
MGRQGQIQCPAKQHQDQLGGRHAPTQTTVGTQTMELLDGGEEEEDEEEEALGMIKREVLRFAWDLWRKGGGVSDGGSLLEASEAAGEEGDAREKEKRERRVRVF